MTAVKPNVDVTSIKVLPASYTIDVGERYTLTATLQPSDATDKTVRWSSNSPNVVRVDNNGTITGVSCGNAIITASSSNGRTSACVVTCANPVLDIVISESDGLSKIPPIANVRYEKTFYKDWNSVCLPFAIDAKIFGSQDLQIAMVNDVDVVGNKRTVSYEFVEQVGAGVACLIHVPEDMTFKIFLSNTNLVLEPDTKGPLVGTFTETVIGEGCYKLASDGQSFAQTKTASAVCKPFRAYIKK